MERHRRGLWFTKVFRNLPKFSKSVVSKETWCYQSKSEWEAEHSRHTHTENIIQAFWHGTQTHATRLMSYLALKSGSTMFCVKCMSGGFGEGLGKSYTSRWFTSSTKIKSRKLSRLYPRLRLWKQNFTEVSAAPITSGLVKNKICRIANASKSGSNF